MNDIQVTIIGDEINSEELSIYLTQIQSKQKRKMIKADITVDSEYIDVKYALEDVPFERIRRITGYLVGATSRWNNAKQSELHDRVCHGVGN
ncbi:MAG: hypothetical protein H7X79_01165 [Sporomusaceae bacterium]|nr:hypothetical protein [Sporomusaceae bacterium]